MPKKKKRKSYETSASADKAWARLSPRKKALAQAGAFNY